MAGADISGALDALAASDDDAIAAQAMELAVALSLWDRGGAGLCIRFADVRTVALAALAGRCSGLLSAQLLALANDPSSRVRRELVDRLLELPREEIGQEGFCRDRARSIRRKIGTWRAPLSDQQDSAVLGLRDAGLECAE